MKMGMHNAFKYNKITIAERCIYKNIRYVGEYQLKFKQSTKYSIVNILFSEALNNITLLLQHMRYVQIPAMRWCDTL